MSKAKALLLEERKQLETFLFSFARSSGSWREDAVLTEILWIDKALAELEKRDKGCKYCEGVYKNKLVSEENSKLFEIKTNMKNNNYCPNCGRKIGER